MKAADVKTATAAQPLQAKRDEQQTPFFQPERKGEALAANDTAFFSPDGNSGIQRKPFFSPPSIQAKLAVGQPGDKYEQEADQVAEQVVQRLAEPDRPAGAGLEPETRNPKPISIQRKPIFESEAVPNMQTKPLTSIPASRPPAIQPKCEACEQEEQLQKMDEPGEEEQLQRKPIFESAAPPPDDDTVQRACADCAAEEETLQTQAESAAASSASPSLESRLSSTKGGGSPLPEDTRSQMEGAMGTDFSGVRVHNDSSAVQMNKELGAQAFTHGSDVYFNSGKYDAGSREGQRLLGHELVHVVQQGGGGPSINKKNISSTNEPTVQRGLWGSIKSAGSWVGGGIASGAKATWKGAKWVGGKIGSGAEWLYDQGSYIAGNAYECAKATGKSVWKLVTLDFDSVGELLGKPKPQGDGPDLLEWIKFVVYHPCLKMIPGYRLLLAGISKLDKITGFLSGVWEIMSNPELILDGIKNALAEYMAKIPNRAKIIAKKVIELGGEYMEHLEGIWRHLLPKLEYLSSPDNWWQLIKETGKDLLWPWPKVFNEDMPLIGEHLKGAVNSLWNLDFGGFADHILVIWRVINTMVGRLYGWIFIASVLIGAILGGIFGVGAGAVPGAIAGAAIAGKIGYALLISMVLAEGLSLQKAVLDLLFKDQTEEEQEEDYEQIASSGLALAITGVMMALGALAVRFARGVIARVSGMFTKKPPKKKSSTDGKSNSKGNKKRKSNKDKDKLPDDIAGVCKIGSINCKKIPEKLLDEIDPYPDPKGFDVSFPKGPYKIRKSNISGVNRSTSELQRIVLESPNSWSQPFKKALAKVNGGQKNVTKAIQDGTTKKIKWPTDKDGNAWQVHHNKPVSFGGGNSVGNLIPLPPAVHRLFNSWWLKLQNRFKARFTDAEWNALMIDKKSTSGSKAANRAT